jgi:hypothetical protein
MEVENQKESESNEVKGASPESENKAPRKPKFGRKADPVRLGSRPGSEHAKTSATRRPGVADSIELHNDEGQPGGDESKSSWEVASKQTRVSKSNARRMREGSVAAIGNW